MSRRNSNWPKLANKVLHARRAAAVHILRVRGFGIHELADIFKTTPGPIRGLAARGARDARRLRAALKKRVARTD